MNFINISKIKKRKKGYVIQSQKTKSTITRDGKKITKNTYRRYSYRSIIKKMNKLFFDTFGYKPEDESTHILRSTFASHLLKEKLDIESIRKLLGHSSIKTTWIYIRNLPDFSEWDKVRSVELMDLNIQLKI